MKKAIQVIFWVGILGGVFALPEHGFFSTRLVAQSYFEPPAPHASALEKDLVKAEHLLRSFKNDSALLIVNQLLPILKTQKELDSPLGLRALLTEGTALERDQNDTLALGKLLHVKERSAEQDNWKVFTLSCLALANLYEKLGRQEPTYLNLQQARSTIFIHQLERLYPTYAVRTASYHRVFPQDHDSAMYYTREVLRTAPLQNMVLDEAIGHMLMAMLVNKRSPEQAIVHFKAAGRLYRQLEDYTGQSYVLSGVASMSFKKGDLETALVYNDSALQAAHRAIAAGHERHVTIGGMYRFRGEIFRVMEKEDSAWFFLNKGYQMEISLMQKSQEEKVIEIDARYNDEQKARQIEEQAQQLQFERRQGYGIAGGALVILIFTLLLYNNLRKLRKVNNLNMKQAEELQALDKLKSKFFANISHELRTPLTLILGPLSYLLDHPEEWEKTSVQKQLRVMQRNGKSLMQLIEEILDLSRLEAKKLALKEQPTSMMQFFENVFFVFEPQFQAKGIRYELNLEVAEDLQIWMDRKKMEKVVNNFLSNAIKFTPRAGMISLNLTETEDSLQLKVADSGSGIHPDDLPHIFERFFQSKQANHQLHGGTGIGLALVSEFADLMGGKVYAESTLGAGSQFYFEWPKRIAQSQDAMAQVSSVSFEEEPIAEIGTDFTILVVEDNPDMRDFVAQVLAQKYTVLTAQNGVEGVEMLTSQAGEIDLVVSDVMMPEMDGLSLLRIIKARPEWQSLPVIMLTALAAERDKLNALTIGVDDYLTKPFSVPELLVRVQNLLYNSQQRRQFQEEEQKGKAKKEVGKEKPTPPEQAIFLSEEDQEWLRQLEAFVLQSLPDSRPDVNVLAEAAALSPRQLSRRLKALTGLSTARFIKEVQLQAARQELEKGSSMSVSEVAYRFGFDHPSTFSHVFKNRFGKSPSGYLSRMA
jgi:signal transduction histidine kinase/DNA-binding response OmpR family regulator